MKQFQCRRVQKSFVDSVEVYVFLVRLCPFGIGLFSHIFAFMLLN